jgi:hypothetical protein
MDIGAQPGEERREIAARDAGIGALCRIEELRRRRR